jgi:hypothetical protein
MLLFLLAQIVRSSKQYQRRSRLHSQSDLNCRLVIDPTVPEEDEFGVDLELMIKLFHARVCIIYTIHLQLRYRIQKMSNVLSRAQRRSYGHIRPRKDKRYPNGLKKSFTRNFYEHKVSQ